MDNAMTIDTDVLVVGGGGAACRAAVAAHDAGAKTILVLKGQLGSSGATVAPGRGVAWQAADACSSSEDSPEVHLRNILDAGLGMADPRLARILAYEVLDRMEELERWGLQFVPDPESEKQHYSAYSCFGDQPRAHCILDSGHGHAGDLVMVPKRQMERRDIEVHEQVFVTDLVVSDGTCLGAVALGPDDETRIYRAGAVVLGAGGARQIFPHSGPHRIDTTGDGYAMALRAGAELTNMEYAQFMLHVVVHRPMQVPGSFWALFPTVRNRLGEETLTRYLPTGTPPEQAMWERALHAPFSCRDASGWLDISISTEIRDGRGTPEDGMLVDFADVDLSRFRPSRPTHIPRSCTQKPVLPEAPLQVRDVAHAINGGILIDEQAESTLHGLFAAGEVAAGPHGADRLGGGMVTNCQVFGARAGRYAAEHALGGTSGIPKASLAAPFGRLGQNDRGTRSANEIMAALASAAGRDLMVVRNDPGLRALIAKIEELRAEWLPNVAIRNAGAQRRAIEAENSLATAELMAQAALMRQESRGSHFREDYPKRDDDRWRVNIILRQRDGRLELSTSTLGNPRLAEGSLFRPIA